MNFLVEKQEQSLARSAKKLRAYHSPTALSTSFIPFLSPWARDFLTVCVCDKSD